MSSSEIELKFAVSADGATAIRDGLFSQCDRSQTQSIYYDTPSRGLRARGLELRVRTQDGRFRQTIKGSAVNGGQRKSPFARTEIETDLTTNTPDAAPLAAISDNGELNADTLVLEPVFSTQFERSKYMCTCQNTEAASIEMCFDVGQIEAQGTSQPLCELELELKHGELRALLSCGLELAQRYDLRLSLDSKADRGYRLYTNERAAFWKPKKTGLPRDLCLKDAVTQSLRDGYTHFLLNHTAFVETGEAETIHQMRVGLRRLRAVVSAFKPVIDTNGGQDVLDAVKTFFSALGEIREIDVFLADVLPTTQDILPDSQRDVLVRFLTARRNDLYTVQRDYAAGPAFTRFVLELGLWIEAQDWARTEDAVKQSWYDRPVKAFARMRLDKLHRRLIKQGQQKQKADFAEWHELRISTKKLRYISEYFCNLFDRSKTKPYIRDLSNWQDRLGRLNDLAVSADFVAGLPDKAPVDDQAVLRDVSLIFRGWSIAMSHAEQQMLSKLWDRFEHTAPFWTSKKNKKRK